MVQTRTPQTSGTMLIGGRVTGENGGTFGKLRKPREKWGNYGRLLWCFRSLDQMRTVAHPKQHWFSKAPILESGLAPILLNHCSFQKRGVVQLDSCVVERYLERRISGKNGEGTPTSYSKYPFCLGYDVDPLLKKEVFTLKNQVFQKYLWSRGYDMLKGNLSKLQIRTQKTYPPKGPQPSHKTQSL